MPYHNIGRGVGRMMQEVLIGTLSMEILYSFVIIVCSLMIYFGTKELYELSGHKGLKYFRMTFLFFAVAYFFRSFIKIVIVYLGKQEIALVAPILFGKLPIFLFMYFSIMAIFYLLYSVLYKKLKHDRIHLFHLASALIAAIIIFMGGNLVLILLINILLLIFIVYVVYLSYNQSKKKKTLNLYMIYFLLSVFWILNILDILIPNVLQGFQLLIYLASSGIFLMILYKVVKKTGAN